MALRRVRRITDFGDYREVENHLLAPMFGNHSPRGEKLKKTVEAVEKNNDRYAVRKCENKIRANFRAGDWWCSLTYDDNHLPPDMETARKNLRNFFCRSRRLCDKKGIELKYCQVTERGSRNGRYHHHIIIPGVISYEELERLWPNGTVFVKRLWSDGNMDKGSDRSNVHRLAEYIIGTNSGKRAQARALGIRQYSFSRNCVEPVVTYELMPAKWIKIPRDTEKWKLVPSSLIEYTDAYGMRHQRYIQTRKKE